MAHMEDIIHRQKEFSLKTFGPGARRRGVSDHIRKELKEIEESNGDLHEWVDVIILALDGAWRSGASPVEVTTAIVDKIIKNEKRKWPDWQTMPPDKAIEHDRSLDHDYGQRYPKFGGCPICGHRHPPDGACLA
jgi:hypothetical protein